MGGAAGDADSWLLWKALPVELQEKVVVKLPLREAALVATLCRRYRELLHSRLSPQHARLLQVLTAGAPGRISAPQLEILIALLRSVIRGRPLTSFWARKLKVWGPWAHEFFVDPKGRRVRKPSPGSNCFKVRLAKRSPHCERGWGPGMCWRHPHFTVKLPGGALIRIQWARFLSEGAFTDVEGAYNLDIYFRDSRDSEWVQALLLAVCLFFCLSEPDGCTAGVRGGTRCVPFEGVPPQVYLQMHVGSVRHAEALAQLLGSMADLVGGSRCHASFSVRPYLDLRQDDFDDSFARFLPRPARPKLQVAVIHDGVEGLFTAGGEIVIPPPLPTGVRERRSVVDT